MLQAFITLLFAAIAIGAIALIGLVLIQDWDAVRAALGLGHTLPADAPLPPRFRMTSARRATFVRIEVAPLRRAA
ncbi:hypothetical protein [Sphingomonas bacterium]|uniref:hypothetical protein n=1 Tax=Sphingomonas bacterium TaxID=1895847 RepID=UPI001575A084|nr:hypothetical protein [Sphingomonas bacterium]